MSYTNGETLERILGDITGILDAYADKLSDDDWMVFLGAINVYLARCTILVNKGKDARELCEELSRGLLAAVDALLKEMPN